MEQDGKTYLCPKWFVGLLYDLYNLIDFWKLRNLWYPWICQDKNSWLVLLSSRNMENHIEVSLPFFYSTVYLLMRYFFYLYRNSSDVLLYVILYFLKVMRLRRKFVIKLLPLMRLLWLQQQRTLASSFTSYLQFHLISIFFCLSFFTCLVYFPRVIFISELLGEGKLCWHSLDTRKWRHNPRFELNF